MPEQGISLRDLITIEETAYRQGQDDLINTLEEAIRKSDCPPQTAEAFRLFVSIMRRSVERSREKEKHVSINTGATKQ